MKESRFLRVIHRVYCKKYTDCVCVDAIGLEKVNGVMPAFGFGPNLLAAITVRTKYIIPKRQ